MCVNENLMALVRLRELRLRGERTRRDENASVRIKCPITGERVTALVARLNVVGGRENTAGPLVDCLRDLRLSSLGFRRGSGEGDTRGGGRGESSPLTCLPLDEATRGTI